MSRQITIKDVAEPAGVSVATGLFCNRSLLFERAVSILGQDIDYKRNLVCQITGKFAKKTAKNCFLEIVFFEWVSKSNFRVLHFTLFIV